MSPGIPLTPGAARWYVLSSNFLLYEAPLLSGGASSTMNFLVVGAPHAAPLLAPVRAIETNAPTFRWEAVTGAAEYHLLVNDALRQRRIAITYSSAAANCDDAKCEVSPGITLASGQAQWWILASTAAGDGRWSEPVVFDVP